MCPSALGSLIGSGQVTVQGVTTKVAVTPTVTASTYALDKVIGGILSFANILPPNSFGGVLESITLKFKASLQTVGFYVSIFTEQPTGTFTDTNTAAIAAGDSALLLGTYHLTGGQSQLGTHTVFNMDGIAKAIQGSSQKLFVVVVPDATSASLASTSDMSLELGVLW